jgi:hypothetical protein
MSFNAFTQRVLDHPRIETSPNNPDSNNDSIVFAIKDELLVSRSSHDQVKTYLSQGLYKTAPKQVVTSCYSGISPPGGEDVDIWQITPPQNKSIFDVVADLRASSALAGMERTVSPNHVLIPASSGDQCPFGEPTMYKGSALHLPAAKGLHGDVYQPVVVVDSGYQWWGSKGWGANPLSQRGKVNHVQAQRYVPDPANPGQLTWLPFVDDVPDKHQAGTLDHLAGHANFVTGVIAQRCQSADITIWNHNAAFVEDDADPYNLPTEASVLHTLAQIANGKPAVVNCGFAFVPFTGKLPDAGLGVHQTWDSTIDQLRRAGWVIVAPAGNQEGSTTPRYPAALDGVVGVASHDASGAPSFFTNVGSWVTCSANGENVHSTFLHVRMKVEGGDGTVQDFRNNWAMWNGTCFAAPKVAAAIANRVDGNLPSDAWDELRQEYSKQEDRNHMLGIVFRDADLVA